LIKSYFDAGKHIGLFKELLQNKQLLIQMNFQYFYFMWNLLGRKDKIEIFPVVCKNLEEEKVVAGKGNKILSFLPLKDDRMDILKHYLIKLTLDSAFKQNLNPGPMVFL
jgi:hypothetical protein